MSCCQGIALVTSLSSHLTPCCSTQPFLSWTRSHFLNSDSLVTSPCLLGWHYSLNAAKNPSETTEERLGLVIPSLGTSNGVPGRPPLEFVSGSERMKISCRSSVVNPQPHPLAWVALHVWYIHTASPEGQFIKRKMDQGSSPIRTLVRHVPNDRFWVRESRRSGKRMKA